MRRQIILQHFSNLGTIVAKYDYYLEGRINLVLQGHTAPITCLAVLPNGQIATGSDDKTCIIWKNGEI